MVMDDGTVETVRIPCGDPPLPPHPSRPRPSPRASPSPRPKGEFTVKTTGLKIVKSSDGFWRGCADPLLYLIYARVIPGVRGSTIARSLGRIDYGENKCSGRYLHGSGGFTRDRVPTNRVSVSGYVLIGIEEDDAGTGKVNAKIAQQVRSLSAFLQKLESTNISPLEARIAMSIPSLIDSRLELPVIGKQSGGFLSLGHDFVGYSALIMIGGSGFSGQPAVCSRAEIPICALNNMRKGVVVGGKVDDNLWRADVVVDAA